MNTFTFYKVVRQFISDELPPFIICDVTLQQCEKAFKVIAGDPSLVGGRRLILLREFEQMTAGLATSIEQARQLGQKQFDNAVSAARRQLRQMESIAELYMVELLKGNVNGRPNKTDAHA